MDTISVIIPNFNRASLIGETLENILNQTLPPYEIIVVDDGSTDNMAPIIAQYKDRVIFTTNKRGKGQGGARNTGMQMAKGNYIKFFDSDDLMTLNSLEVQLNRLKESKLPFVYSPYVHCKKNISGNWVQLEPILGFYRSNNSKIISSVMKGYFHPIFTMLFKREFLNFVGFWYEGTIAEDFNFFFRALQSGPNFAHTNECCTFYRMHGAQSMGTNISNLDRDLEKCDVFWELLTKYKPGVALYSDKNEAYFRVLWSNTVMALPVEKRKYYRATIGDRIYRLFHRIEQKLGRLVTRTDWQPYHEPNPDSETFTNFTNNIYLNQ